MTRYFVISLLLLQLGYASAFSTTATTKSSLFGTNSALRSTTTSTTTASQRATALRLPVSWDEMVRQVAAAMKAAAAAGHSRQIVRVLLPRDKNANEFGVYRENNSYRNSMKNMDLEQSVLVPPDESWQGGILQIYRAAAWTTHAILRRLTEQAQSGLPPRISEDRSVDESGVDGIGRFTTDDGAVTCWLQPTQEIIDTVLRETEKESKQSVSDTNTNSKITVLLNPQWRMVDDALDSASQGSGFFAGLANFLGGKGATLKRLAAADFVPVCSLEGYVCRGANVRLMQLFDTDWAVFCERDDGERFVPVGTSVHRPTYQQVDQMLQDNQIGYKYARDMGMERKF